MTSPGARRRGGAVARFTLSLALALAPPAAAAPAPPRPALLITAFIDDFGYASASFNRAPGTAPPETLTPHMDALAREGVVLTRYHVHPFCSPSRASFMSGRLPVHVQQTNTQPDRPNAGVPFNMTTLPEFLRLAGAPVDAYVLGKYDVGAATARHTPEGRGFNGSLVYFSHAIDAFTQNDYAGAPGAGSTCDDRFVDLWSDGAPAPALNGTAYADDLFLARALALIGGHDFAGGRTLWLHVNTHATHDPLQATAAMLAPLNYTADDEGLCNASVSVSSTGAFFPGAPTDPASWRRCRRVFEAMTQWVDGALGQLRAAAVRRGVWNASLMLVSSDNGGQLDLAYGGGSNFPLRGGKGSNFEGGTRVMAFASGGLVPAARRGATEHGLMHAADALATVCGLLGAADACREDARARAAGLPPLDSLDLWPLISGANSTSPRTEVPVGPDALISGRFKLLLGRQGQAGWDGPLAPNASSPAHDPHAPSLDCSGALGCLFDVLADPGEHNDVAAENPAVAAAMAARLAELRKGFFSNSDGEAGLVCAHDAALNVSDGACACGRAAATGFFEGAWARPRWGGKNS